MKKISIVACIFIAASFCVLAQTSVVDKKASMQSGKKVYDQYCLACHQADGGGVPRMNPPLQKTDYVNGDKKRLINIVLKGLNDPIEINGEEYVNPMASHAHLSDQQIADVLTYIRNNFGNKATAVSPSEVKALRVKK
jgi:mono/diheme cytochrome c family protein